MKKFKSKKKSEKKKVKKKEKKVDPYFYFFAILWSVALCLYTVYNTKSFKVTN